MSNRPDLRSGDPRVHDVVAQLDEAIEAGDEARMAELTEALRLLDPNAGAGGDT